MLWVADLSPTHTLLNFIIVMIISVYFRRIVILPSHVYKILGFVCCWRLRLIRTLQIVWIIFYICLSLWQHSIKIFYYRKRWMNCSYSTVLFIPSILSSIACSSCRLLFLSHALSVACSFCRLLFLLPALAIAGASYFPLILSDEWEKVFIFVSMQEKEEAIRF